MQDNKLGRFQSKGQLESILKHPLSKNEFRMIINQKSTTDKDISAHIRDFRDLLQKIRLKKTETKTFGINLELGFVETDKLEKDLNEGYKFLKKFRLIHHGPINSKDPITKAWEMWLVALRYENLLKLKLSEPMLKNINCEELMNGMNIIIKNFCRELNRESGEKIISLNRFKLTPSSAFFDKCFVDGITKEMWYSIIRDLPKVLIEVLIPGMITLGNNNPEQISDMIFKDAKTFFIIYTMRRIEEKQGIKILKTNSELMEIMGIKKSRYYKNLNQIESKFLMVSPSKREEEGEKEE